MTKKKPEFIMRDRNRTPMGEPVRYTPIMVIAGSDTHRLALRKVGDEWQVSHPEIGAKVLLVEMTHRGVPMTTRGLTIAQARNLAIKQIDLLIERVGSAKFNTVIERMTKS